MSVLKLIRRTPDVRPLKKRIMAAFFKMDEVRDEIIAGKGYEGIRSDVNLLRHTCEEILTKIDEREELCQIKQK